MNDKENKVAVVVGASRGIGHSCATGLAKAGVDVVVASRSQQEIKELAAGIEAAGRRSLAVRTDVTKREDIENLFSRTIDRFGHVDILVYCSGIARVERSIAESSDGNYRDIMDVNVRGAYWSIREVLNRGGMLERKSGRVIVVASDSAKRGEPGLVVYNTSKHAVLGLVRGAAMELGEKGITVNAVCPGFVDTDMAHDLAPRLAEIYNVDDSNLDEFLKSCDPLHRLAKPEEIAEVVIFLATTAGGGAMTGQGVTMATTIFS